MNIDKDLNNFVANYQGPKVAIIAMGAGMSLAQIPMVPGASRVFGMSAIPYDTEIIKLLLSKTDDSDYVSEETIMKSVDQLIEDNSPYTYIIVTGALTTSTRYRQGDNHAFVYIGNAEDGHVYHIQLPKITERTWKSYTQEKFINLRQKEDAQVTKVILGLLMNKPVTLSGVTVTHVESYSSIK